MPKKALTSVSDGKSEADCKLFSRVGCVGSGGDELARAGLRLGGFRGCLVDSQEAPHQARDDQEGDRAFQMGQDRSKMAKGKSRTGVGTVEKA